MVVLPAASRPGKEENLVKTGLRAEPGMGALTNHQDPHVLHPEKLLEQGGECEPHGGGVF